MPLRQRRYFRRRQKFKFKIIFIERLPSSGCRRSMTVVAAAAVPEAVARGSGQGSGSGAAVDRGRKAKK